MRPQIAAENWQGPALETRTWQVRMLLDYWHDKCGTRLMPSRRDIDPTEIPRLLSNLFLAEVRGPHEVRLRLAGAARRDRLGRETTGANLLSEVPENLRESRAYACWMLITRPCGYYVLGRMSGETWQIPRELLVLPLSPIAAGGPPILIGVTAALDDQGWHFAPKCLGDYESAEHFLDIGAGVPAQIDPTPGWDQI